MLDRVGRAVAPEPLDDYTEYRFYIFRGPFPNAFALPDGQVFVTSGMFALLENEAQLACVLAHEVTHTEGHHGVTTYRSMRKKSMVNAVLSPILDVAGAVYLGVAGLGSYSNYFMVVSILGYTRDLEIEADDRGFERALAAGYDPHQMGRLFSLMDRDIEGEQPKLQTVWSTHPDLEARALRLNRRADSLARQGKLDGVVEGDPDILFLTHEIALDVVDDFINEDYPRHAVAMARDLVARAAEDPRCHCALADALRALGGRAEKTATDLTEKQKKSAVQSRQAMTREERREALLQTREPGGSSSELPEGRRVGSGVRRGTSRARLHVGGTGRASRGGEGIRQILEAGTGGSRPSDHSQSPQVDHRDTQRGG
jgi:hypothetical protein